MQRIVLGAIVAMLFLTAGVAFAQEISFGKPAVQEVKITINEKGSAHVVHMVQSSNTPQQLYTVSNDFVNLQVTDEEGGSAEYGETGGDKVSLMIFPTNKDLLVEYDVDGFVAEKNGMWTLGYRYLASTAFYFPDTVDLVFANTNPVDLTNTKGVKCHGCQINLEYELKKTEATQKIQWEDKKFDVSVITQADISKLELDQPNKKISFAVNEANKYVTLIIPKELLGNPYEVFLNSKPFLHHESPSVDHTLLSMKPNETGTIQIIGVTVIPEFPVAAILVLSVAMIFAAKFTKTNLR
jgi:predicted secreted protein with PEFG-CTERM motif